MSGKFLDDSFSLPCPPGLKIPPETVSPFTSNNLKVYIKLTYFLYILYTYCIVLFTCIMLFKKIQ